MVIEVKWNFNSLFLNFDFNYRHHHKVALQKDIWKVKMYRFLPKGQTKRGKGPWDNITKKPWEEPELREPIIWVMQDWAIFNSSLTLFKLQCLKQAVAKQTKKDYVVDIIDCSLCTMYLQAVRVEPSSAAECSLQMMTTFTRSSCIMQENWKVRMIY